MKQLLLLTLVFSFLNSVGQEKEFYLQGQVIDAQLNPIVDAYIFNARSADQNISRTNGIFDVWVLPGDTIIISHISFLRKIVTVHQLMINPIVQLELDTVNILPVNVSASKMSDYKKAKENIESIEFDFRPQPDDEFTESQRMLHLLKTENRVERTAAASMSLTKFSPSEEIEKLIAKRKKKKEAKQFSSTKKSKQDEDK